MRKNNRTNVAERFTDVDVRKSVEVDLSITDHLTEQIKAIENYIMRHAKKVDPRTFFSLHSVPGSGEILAMVMRYEVQDIQRFPTVQSFCSYARLVKCSKESAGQRYGFSGA